MNDYAIPDFHDGFLDAIILAHDRQLILKLRSVAGSHWTVVIPKLIRLRADGFAEGNIIFEINVYSGRNCPEQLVRKVYGYNEERSAMLLSKNLETIASENWTLFELSASYGCELLALSAAEACDIEHKLE